MIRQEIRKEREHRRLVIKNQHQQQVPFMGYQQADDLFWSIQDGQTIRPKTSKKMRMEKALIVHNSRHNSRQSVRSNISSKFSSNRDNSEDQQKKEATLGEFEPHVNSIFANNMKFRKQSPQQSTISRSRRQTPPSARNGQFSTQMSNQMPLSNRGISPVKLQEGFQESGQFYMPKINGQGARIAMKPVVAAPKKEKAANPLEGYSPNKMGRKIIVKPKQNFSFDKINIMQVKVLKKENERVQEGTDSKTTNATEGAQPVQHQPFGLKLAKLLSSQKNEQDFQSSNFNEFNKQQPPVRVNIKPIQNLLQVPDGKDEFMDQTQRSDNVHEKLNLHKNFIDISEEHRRLRTLRAHKMASVWMNVLGKDLKNLVQVDKKKIYREQFKNGASLSLLQLKQLDSELKRDYFNEIIKRDRNNTLKIEQIFQTTMKKHQSLLQSMEEMESLKNLWPDSVEVFNKKVQEKILKYGLHKEGERNIPQATPRGQQKAISFISSKTIGSQIKTKEVPPSSIGGGFTLSSKKSPARYIME